MMPVIDLRHRRVQLSVSEPWQHAGSDSQQAQIEAIGPPDDGGRVTTCLLSLESGIEAVPGSDCLVASVRYTDANLQDLLDGSDVHVNCAPVPEALRGTSQALAPATWWRGGDMLICSITLTPE